MVSPRLRSRDARNITFVRDVKSHRFLEEIILQNNILNIIIYYANRTCDVISLTSHITLNSRYY